MHVSTEVRRPEPAERPTDPTNYAAATGAGSFLAMLTEMTRPPEKSEAETTPTDDSSKGTTIETEGTQETEAGTTQAKAADGAAEPEESDGVTAKAPAEAANKPTTTSTVIDASATPEAVNNAPAPKAAVAITLAASTTATAPQSTVTESLLVPTAMTPESADLIAKLTDSAAARAAGGESGEVTMEASVETETPPPPTASFPKTLNALIAEEAVRPMAESDGAAPPGTEVSAPDVTELPAELNAAEPPLPEEAQPVALPRAAALETAGVRPEISGAPRVPLANLPGNLAQQINLMQQEGSRTMRIRLAPEHLGEIQIEIQGSGDALRVRLTSAVPAVRDVLENQMADLKDALQKQGIALDQATVDSESARQRPAEERNMPQRAPHARPTLEVPPPARTAKPAQPTAGSSALNLLV